MKFKLSYFDRPFEVSIKTVGDLAVLEEVFLMREYDWQLESSPKVIIDLGAHYGDTTLFYHLKYPESKIFAIEPAPDTFKHLCMNVDSIPEVKSFQLGISNKDGSSELHISPNSFGSSFSRRNNEVGTVEVPVCTLRSLLDMNNIVRADLIKFDIEGSEDSLFLHGAPEDYADAYIGEVHKDLMVMNAEEFLLKFKNFEVQTEALPNPQRFILKAIKKTAY